MGDALTFVLHAFLIWCMVALMAIGTYGIIKGFRDVNNNRRK